MARPGPARGLSVFEASAFCFRPDCASGRFGAVPRMGRFNRLSHRGASRGGRRGGTSGISSSLPSMVHVESVGGRCPGVPGASENQRLRWAVKPFTVKNRDRAGPIFGLAGAGMPSYTRPNWSG